MIIQHQQWFHHWYQGILIADSGITGIPPIKIVQYCITVVMLQECWQFQHQWVVSNHDASFDKSCCYWLSKIEWLLIVGQNWSIGCCSDLAFFRCTYQLWGWIYSKLVHFNLKAQGRSCCLLWLSLSSTLNIKTIIKETDVLLYIGD